MSHFSVWALLPSIENVEAHLEELLAPFDVNTEVDPYETECYCVGAEARRHGQAVADRDVKPMESLRDEYWKLPEPRPSWETHILSWVHAAQQAEADHPLFARPNPKCEQCNGSGRRQTTYNPKSKWDWWQIGGRWTGMLDPSYDPEKDPENAERCFLCKGSGQRSGGACAQCQGTGKTTAWPTSWAKYSGDIMPIENIPPNVTPFALLTPDGEWHEHGRMGWWGMVSEEKEDFLWADEVRGLLKRWPGTIVVVVDCHI